MRTISTRPGGTSPPMPASSPLSECTNWSLLRDLVPETQVLRGFEVRTATGSTTVTVILPPPSCASATASPNLLWPPNHKFVAIHIGGIGNPAPGAVTISVTSIFQDEPTSGDPDATGVGTANPTVRSERDGGGDGRVYHINFTATGASGSCTGSVTVGVPHDQGHGSLIDGGSLYNSTTP
ncbi:MAG TPA: hypothetical protein VF173_30800 [Thermoanaerobaculia bacterium]|nr:hypothetical protein [Thermoanaerobaculia bacterium]